MYDSKGMLLWMTAGISGVIGGFPWACSALTNSSKVLIIDKTKFKKWFGLLKNKNSWITSTDNTWSPRESSTAGAVIKDGRSLLAANATFKLMLMDANATAEVGPRTDLMDYWNPSLEAFKNKWINYTLMLLWKLSVFKRHLKREEKLKKTGKE